MLIGILIETFEVISMRVKKKRERERETLCYNDKSKYKSERQNTI